MMVSVVICISAYNPSWINDHNHFLAGFVNHEFLALMGVIVSITLASIGQLHLSLNEIEKEAGQRFLIKTRANVRNSAYALILIFVFGFFIVIVKGSIAGANPGVKDHIGFAFINGGAVIILAWASMILTSIVQAVFAIKPRLPNDH
jgi:hypothetical protein